MSTKTTLKRIALVAVSGLGLGLLSVAPASAATTVPTVSKVTQTVSVGAAATVVVGATVSANASNTATVTLTYPSGSAVRMNDANGDATTGDFAAATVSVVDGTVITAATVARTNTTTDSYSSITGATANAGTFASYSITPDLPGLYTLTVTAQDATTEVAYIWAWTTAVNGATLVGVLGDGGFPSNNSAVNGVAGPANTVTVRAFPSTTSGVRRLISVEGSGAYITSTSGATVTLATGTNPTTGTIASQAATDAHLFSDVTIATPTAGTVTVKLFSETASGSGIFSATAAGTVTVTVYATGSSGTLSVGLSTVYGNDVSPWGAASAVTDAAVATLHLGTGTPTARIRYDIKVRDVLGALRTASATALTAAVSGAGLINTSTSNTGAARVSAITWDGNLATLYLFNDGTAGASTVTFYWGSTVLATKSTTFTGSPKTLTATAWEPHITASTVSEAVEVKVADSLGNPTTWTTSVASSAPAIISNTVSCTRNMDPLATALGYTYGAYYCDVTGVSTGDAVLTFNPGSLTTNSPTVALKVTKSVASSVVLKTDKDSYAPGEKITLTIEAKDSDGFLLGAIAASAGPVYYDLLAADSTATTALQGTPLSGTSIYLSAGSKSTSLYAPLVSGPVTFRATLAANAFIAPAIQGTVVTKTINVTASSAELAAEAAADAAAEAIDAANAATDAANLAAEAADAATVAAEEARDAADAATAAIEELATQVATLMAALKAQITTLANTVAKIAKKIRA